MRIKSVIIAITIVVLLIATSFWFFIQESKPKLKVLHAGSLALPFSWLENEFEKKEFVNVQREVRGSAKLVRSIVDLNKECDVLAVSDSSLIKNELIPNYASWYVNFATNRMVLAYTERSKYSNEINPTNWYKILLRATKFGFGDPNNDPCGYRALILIQLAEIYYNDSEIFDKLVEENTAITSTENNNKYLIKSPEVLAPNTNKIAIRPKAEDLIYLLQSHDLDYAFEYSSVATQHNLKYLSFSEQIDLSNFSYKDIYSRVRIERYGGKISRGEPIVYALTIPKSAKEKKIAIEFVKFLLEKYKAGEMANYSQHPIVPAQVYGENLPLELQSLVEK